MFILEKTQGRESRPSATKAAITIYRRLWDRLVTHKHDPVGEVYVKAWHDLHQLEDRFRFNPEQLRQARNKR